MDPVTSDEIQNLINIFAKQTYCATAQDDETNSILQRSIKLLERDYSVALVPNNNGELCINYPSQLPILEYEKFGNNKNVNLPHQTNTAGESIDVQKTHDLFYNARLARCRTRFPIPVILYRGKHICRSSTLSRGFEMYGRASVELFDCYMTRITGKLFKSPVIPEVQEEKQSEEDETLGEVEIIGEDEILAANATLREDETPGEDDSLTEFDDLYEYSCESAKKSENSTMIPLNFFDQIRGSDIELLKRFNVETIMDLMVENKKVKYGMYMSSSEKVEKPLYVDFNLIAIPYPGCEFFKNFRDQYFQADNLIFDWGQEQCDAALDMSEDPLHDRMNIEWSNYKSWDLVTMTQNYIKYILKHFQENTYGILVHCISGWDRTPLFISMLRLSLWADGLIHKSLDSMEILYLTIAYDWMLFGHNLANRLAKKEEVFFFCFFMLKHLTGKDFASSTGRAGKNENMNKAVEDFEPQMIFDSEPEEYNSPSSKSSPETNSLNGNTDEYNGNISDDLKSERTSPVDDITASNPELSASSSSVSLDDYIVIGPTGSLHDMSAMDNFGMERRHKRLTQVRENFYLAYFKSGAANIKYAPESPFGHYIHSLMEKFGYKV